MRHFRGHVWELGAGSRLDIVRASDQIIEAKPAESAGARLPYWALDYCFSGGCRFKVSPDQAKWFTRETGTYRLYAPGTVLREDFSCVGFPRRSVYLIFAGDDLGGVQKLVRDFGVACFRDDSGKLLQLMLEIIDIGERCGDAGHWEALARLCSIIDLLCGMKRLVDENFVLPSETREPSQVVRAAMESIEKSVSGKTSLRSLAKELGMSPSTLSHRFSQETGVSPIACHSQLRINHAKRMLKLGDPVKIVADQLGYCDIYHFSKNFKKLTGMTPTMFRAKAVCASDGGRVLSGVNR